MMTINRRIWLCVALVCFVTYGECCTKDSTVEVDDSEDKPPSDDYADGDPTTKQIVNDLLGPFDEGDFSEMRSGALSISKDSDLNCGFDEERCCWHNVGEELDDADWLVLSKTPDQDKAQELFNSKSTPKASFLVTGHVQSNELDYSMVASCPVNCQRGTGKLNFDYWLSSDLAMDVCVLPLSVESSDFSWCKSLDPSKNYADIEIPEQTEPFSLVIVASEFTEWPGGVAAIDNIKYDANVCAAEGSLGGNDERNQGNSGNEAGAGGPSGGAGTGSTTQSTGEGNTTPSGSATTTSSGTDDQAAAKAAQYKQLCAALSCDFAAVAAEVKQCGWSPAQQYLKGKAKDFELTSRRTGNWAAGVLKRDDGDVYAGGKVPPDSVLAYQSGEFYNTDDMQIDFEVFEQAADTNARMCIGEVSDQTCQVISDFEQLPSHRAWRKATVYIEKKQISTKRRVIMVSENNGQQQAAVGISDISVTVYDSNTGQQFKLDCDSDPPQLVAPDFEDYTDIRLQF